MSGTIIGAIGAVGQVARTSTDLLNLFQTPGEISQSIGNARLIDNSGQSWAGGSWRDRLQPGSWRGVGFILDAGETHAGRRLAIHEYPYRDTAWGEDLGKLPRRFNVQAFLAGDDVYSQRDAMLAACEQPGSGTLVHPTLGSVEVVLLDFVVVDRRERGRVVEIVLQFMLASDVRYPGTAISTAGAVASAAASVNQAAAGALSTALSPLRLISNAAADVSGFTSQALSVVNDATRVFNSVNGLAGYFGRFATGKRGTTLPYGSTVASALATATTTGNAVVSTANAVQQLAAAL